MLQLSLLQSLLQSTLESYIMTLVLKEDRTSMVLDDGASVGKGRVSVAYLGVIMQVIACIEQKIISLLVRFVCEEENI